ncbi:hypothetical protein [Methylobacterium sp. WL120]|uniref:hypothetical protein n=1 Tax=Methylobacterium sp. WL120 TaxID=2603887 RepID=UPI0011C7561C|nr:hypothetical protein [Methylobacterium sp. WL120]TXM69616.1 hypothetical protein FV229_04540 [Methylobacterium sp. WL120]
MPPPARIPEVPLKPPPGFRFGSNSPRLDYLVHLDNDHPYRRAMPGESLRIFKGPMSREVIAMGMVVGRMGSRDERSRHRGPHDYLDLTRPEGWPGIYFTNEDGKLEWRWANEFWRHEDGILSFNR